MLRGAMVAIAKLLCEDGVDVQGSRSCNLGSGDPASRHFYYTYCKNTFSFGFTKQSDFCNFGHTEMHNCAIL